MQRLVSAIMAVALFVSSGPAIAQTAEQIKGELNQTNSQINKLQSQVDQLEHEAETLEGQLAVMDREIRQIQGRINDTNAKIASLSGQIAEVNARMASKKKSLDEFLRSDYYLSSSSTLEMLAGSDSLADFMDRRAYLEAGQDQIYALLAEINAIKKELEAKKGEQDQLNQKLAQEKAGIDAQRAAKDQLLVKTRGEQASYKVLLDQANAAKQRLSSGLAKLMGNGPIASRGWVNRGDVIGREGSTGFSTGSHVHFSTYVNNTAQNPNTYIANGRVGWPLNGFSITQNYGPASWKNPNYSFHDGIDMTTGYGAPVLAACSGNIIFNSFQPDGFGHYIVIDCGGGLWALTGHMI